MSQPKGNPSQRKSTSLNDLTSDEHYPDPMSRLSRFPRLSWFFRGKGVKKEKIDPELEVNQRVVTFIDDDASRGTVRHIGEEKDSNGNVQKILGLEMDKMLSIGGCGRRNGRKLFSCEEGFSLFIPVESVMLEREFDAEPEAPETPEEESSEEFDWEFDTQSDDDSSELDMDIVSRERKLEVERNHCTPSNSQEEEYREREEDWKMQSTALREEMTNWKGESGHVWDETATLHGQLMKQSILVSSESLAQGLTGPDADLDEETKHQNNEISELQVKREQLVKEGQGTVLNKAPQDSEKQQDNALGQTQDAEEDPRISQDDFPITAVRFHEAEEVEDEERRVENLSSDLSETEQRLREELIRTEIRVVLLNNQLMSKQQQVKNLQRKIEKMEQQLTIRELQKEIFRTQRDKEQRLLAELNEKETTEILLRKQLRGKDCLEAKLQRRLSKQEEELEKQQGLREELIEKEAGEILLRKQLREMDCLEASFRRQLSEKRQELEEKDKGHETLREEFREVEGRLREEITEKDARQLVLCEQIEEKDQQLTEMKQQMTATEERDEDLKTQIRNVEEQLRENEDRFENLRTNLRDVEQQLTQKEAQEENLCSILKQMEQRIKEVVAEKETRETELYEQLRGKEEQALDLQRRLSVMEKQLSEKNDQKRTLLRQLTEMEQRSREETAETEMRENRFLEQLREREQEVREIRQKLTEKEQQEENLRTQLRVHLMEQRLREEMIEEATRIGEQLRERDQQIENFQMQLRQHRQQLREREEQLANFRMQLEEREYLRTDFQHQFEEIEAENANLRQQVDNLQNHDQLGTRSHDWVISRDDIQLTGKSLGVGGWGEVFEGKYCGCSVAVKRIHEEINSPYNQNLFQREIDIASRCRHPCLLQFIGATNDEEIPLFVTELMESNLRELLGQRPLSLKEITVISLDVARALSYLHQRRPSPILHRDVSSSNVLLWRRNNQWRGKVSDYGSAKFEEQYMSIGPGCFAYSAPEVQQSENQTAKIDVYSFGVLLCEMYIQTYPDYQNRECQIALVTDLVLQDLVRCCLRSDPSERPDMTDIISRLEQFNETL